MHTLIAYSSICVILTLFGHLSTFVSARPSDPIIVPRNQRRHYVNNHLYFIGKRTSEDLSPGEAFDPEDVLFHGESRNECITTRQCPEDHCCIQRPSYTRDALSYGQDIPETMCAPKGKAEDPCLYSGHPAPMIPFVCGCQVGLQCLVFETAKVGICIKAEK